MVVLIPTTYNDGIAIRQQAKREDHAASSWESHEPRGQCHRGVAQIRRPMSTLRCVGSPCSRLTVRELSTALYQPPPRDTGASTVSTERVHSQTLPAMSSAPTGLRDAGCEPTSSGPNASGSRP